MLWEEADDLYYKIAITDVDSQNGEEHKTLAKRMAGDFLDNFDHERDLILLSAIAGHEEMIIEGVQESLGQAVSIFGGSAATMTFGHDNAYVSFNERISENGFILAHLRSSRDVKARIIGGYRPRQERGIITKCKGRVIMEIDHRPALQVYNQWRSFRGSIGCEEFKVVLLETTPYTLGNLEKSVSSLHGNKDYWISAVFAVDEVTQSLIMLSEVHEGGEIILLEADRQMMIERLDWLLSSQMQGRSVEELRGVFIIYCAACVNYIGIQNMGMLSELLQGKLGNVPVLGLASFGEQGCMSPADKSHHGNTMCAAILVFDKG